MAKGGGKRTYTRDGRGRFASTPGSAAKKAAKSTSGRASTLGARTGLKGSKAKLKAKDKADQTLQTNLSTRAQKGAVTRGSRKLAAAKVAAKTRISGGRKGVIGKPKGLKPGDLKRKGDAEKKIPRLQFDSAATSRRLARATARIDKAFDEQNTFMVNKLARARRSYMLVQSVTKGDAKQAKDIYQKEPRYSTVRNPKNSLTPKSKPPGNSVSAQTRKPPARTKGSRASFPRTPGTVAKPKGLKPSPLSKASSKAPMKPLKGVGAVVARNLQGFKGMPVQIRSRKQAAQAQREKARILGEVGRNAPGAYGPMERRGSMKIKYGANKQINIYGGVDTVKNRKSITFSDRTVLGDSARLRAVKKKAISAENRVVKLNNQRSEQIAAMTTKDFRRNSEASQRLAKTERSIRTLKKAADYYVDKMSSASKSRPRKPRKPKQ